MPASLLRHGLRLDCRRRAEYGAYIAVLLLRELHDLLDLGVVQRLTHKRIADRDPFVHLRMLVRGRGVYSDRSAFGGHGLLCETDATTGEYGILLAAKTANYTSACSG